MKYISLETKDTVGVLTMNFERENRMNPDMMAEMLEALDTAEKDKAVRAIVITGADPKFFSNGLDLNWIMAHIADPGAVEGYLKKMNEVFMRWCLYPKPVVAAINGHAFAGGAFMAGYADFRFMREDKGWVCMPEVDINIPLLPGMIAIMKDALTPQGFREMYYTGRRLTAPEAMKAGFIDRLCSAEELLPQSIAFAAELGKKKTATYAEMKRRIRTDIARILEEVDPGYFAKTLSFSMSS